MLVIYIFTNQKTAAIELYLILFFDAWFQEGIQFTSEMWTNGVRFKITRKYGH